MENKVNDLRSALALLKSIPGQLIETDAEVEPMAELSGVYRHVGAGGTVMRPTKEGPASDQCWLIKVTAVTHRKDPIMQTCIGPSEEHVSMAGIPTEASIYGMIQHLRHDREGHAGKAEECVLRFSGRWKIYGCPPVSEALAK